MRIAGGYAQAQPVASCTKGAMHHDGHEGHDGLPQEFTAPLQQFVVSFVSVVVKTGFWLSR